MIARLPVVAAMVLVATCGTASAQQLVPPPEAPPAVAPGWTFTPSIGVASSWDDNVALTSPQQGELSDQVTTAFSSFSSQYRGRRGDFLLEYRGLYDFYRQYTAFNAPEHRARLDTQRRLTPAVTAFVRDSFLLAPTTQMPFSESALLTLTRRTTSTNDLRTGLDITPWRRTLITAAYGHQWIDLAGDEQVDPLLRGGYAHVGDLTVKRQFWPRVALGGAYDLQHAIVSGGAESFQIQRAEALADFALSLPLTFVGRAGWAWQRLGAAGAQSAPSFSAELRYRGERTLWSVGYERTYLASFGFGGTVQNREARASLEVPVNRRFSLSASLSLRDNEPLQADALQLRGVTFQGTAVVNLVSWLRLETYVLTSGQDSQVGGGQIDRTIAGVRLLSVHPMRMR